MSVVWLLYLAVVVVRTVRIPHSPTPYDGAIMSPL